MCDVCTQKYVCLCVGFNGDIAAAERERERRENKCNLHAGT